jgi:phosphosulfolactate synthase (CoM biosynthesis protein A)
VLEISSGFLSIPTEDWVELTHAVAKAGLKPKPEIGIQWGAGGDASVAELESAGTRDPAWLIGRGKELLDAGAYMLMIESEGITENVREWRESSHTPLNTFSFPLLIWGNLKLQEPTSFRLSTLDFQPIK